MFLLGFPSLLSYFLNILRWCPVKAVPVKMTLILFLFGSSFSTSSRIELLWISGMVFLLDGYPFYHPSVSNHWQQQQHPFYGLFSSATWISQYHSGSMKQEMMGWQWHQLDHMQIICTLLHASTSSLIFTAQMLLPPNQKHWRKTTTTI